MILTRQRNRTNYRTYVTPIISFRRCLYGEYSGGSVFNSRCQVSAMLVNVEHSLIGKVCTISTGINQHEVLTRKTSS